MSNNNTSPAVPDDTTVGGSAPPPATVVVTSQPPATNNAPAPATDSPSQAPPAATPAPGPAPAPSLLTSVVSLSPTAGQSGPVIVTVTSSAPVVTNPAPVASSTSQESSSTSSASTAATSSAAPASGLPQTTVIAVAVVVPLVVVALLVLAGIFFWRKRKERKNNEELRKAEINDYIYNPNSEPPSGGMGSSDDGTAMKEAGSHGYRGWGTTSTAGKMSAGMSSPPSNMDRSNSGNRGPMTGSSGDGHIDEAISPQAETVGALGAAPVAGNRTGAGVHRGPSNASSAYSGANRSEISALSGEGSPQNNVGSPQYYTDMGYPEGGGDGQPVIRDVSARRNTRIESPSVLPQQGNAGIAQNF